MRKKFARALRKWADLIDPRVGPSDTLTIRIDVDAVSAEEKLRLLESRLERMLEMHKAIR